MNHPIAQFVALACHANAILRGRTIPPFFPGHSTCMFCDWVEFVYLSKTVFAKIREERVARNPDAWFAYLKAAGVSAVHLSCTLRNDPRIPDRMAAAFVDGAGVWAMESLHRDDKRAIWLSRWEVWNQNAPELRIWRVTYGRASETRSVARPPAELATVAGRLRSALADIHEFSNRQGCGGFATRFGQALETLDSGGAKRYGYHKDLAPDGALPPLAVCLLDACQSAWVFGGMGSWNDLAFRGSVQAEYDRCSERLYHTLIEAIQAAANASYQAP